MIGGAKQRASLMFSRSLGYTRIVTVRIAVTVGQLFVEFHSSRLLIFGTMAALGAC